MAEQTRLEVEAVEMVKLKAALNQEEVIMLDGNKMYQSFIKTLNQSTSEISSPNGSFNFNGIEQDEITNMLQETLVEEQLISAAASTASFESDRN